MGDSWKWGRYRGADVRHLLRIPEFSRMNLFVGGGRDIVNASNRGHGPCWRMVVEMGPEVRAWGIYPGGQSGNPGSRHYDSFVDTWVRGELDELLFMQTPDDDRRTYRGTTDAGCGIERDSPDPTDGTSHRSDIAERHRSTVSLSGLN